MRYWTIRIGDKWVCVNLYQVIVAGAIVWGIIFFSISTAVLSINSNINAGKIIKEKKREGELETKLKNLKLRIDSINMKLDLITDLDNKERLVWGLPNIDGDIRKLGVGGKRFTSRISMTDAIKEAIQEIRRKIEFESASFGEIYNQIEKKKKLLLHTPSIWPTFGTMTSGFGWRSFGGKEFHKAIDIAGPPGTPVVASASGVVDYVGNSSGLGLIVEIDHGFGYMTQYAHLSRALVKQGQYVKRGQVIGAIGTSGRSTGPHLHYGVKVIDKEVDPLLYIISGTTTY